MLMHSLKSAFRSIIRYRQNSFIIILSLSIAFVSSNLLSSFLLFELSTDSFHQHKDRIYRVLSNDPFGKDGQLRYITWKTLRYLNENFPEVESVCSIGKLENNGIRSSDNELKIENVNVVQTKHHFLDLFDYPILEGNPKNDTSKNGVILTAELAQRIYKKRPYLNQVVDIQLDTSFLTLPVLAVIDLPYENTQLKFDALVINNEFNDYHGGAAFMLLNKKANIELLVEKINEDPRVPGLIGPGELKYDLIAFTDSYFQDENVQSFEKSRSSWLIKVAFLVLLVLFLAVGLNFATLYIIGLFHRKKEIGLRKTLGASRWMLGNTVIIEVVLYIFISSILAIGITILVLPYFNLMFETNLSLAYLANLKIVVMIVGSLLFLALAVSAYLSFYLWRLNTIKLLTDNSFTGSKINKWLFVTQLWISGTLMICAIILIQQMHYVKTKPLGFNRHLIELKAPNEAEKSKIKVLKNLIIQQPGINKVAISSGNPISGNWITRYELENDQFYSPYLLSGDLDLTKALQLKLLEGEFFQDGLTSGKIVNQTLVKELNLKNPVGAKLPGTEDRIIGVVEDFNVVSLKQSIPPYIISFSEDQPNLLVDISDATLAEIISQLERNWSQIYPDYPFEYRLLEDELLAKHHEDAFFLNIIISFALISILISCFGLYGIAAFTTRQRTVEIGIRKVMGAGMSNLLWQLNKDLFRLVLITMLIAVPIGRYLMQNWLERFSYRVEISFWILMMPVLLVLMLAGITVSQLTFKTASENPVNSINRN